MEYKYKLGLSNIHLPLSILKKLKRGERERERGGKSTIDNPTMKMVIGVVGGDEAVSFAEKKKKGMHLVATSLHHLKSRPNFRLIPESAPNYSLFTRSSK